jgi:hypothetical protein
MTNATAAVGVGQVRKPATPGRGPGTNAVAPAAATAMVTAASSAAAVPGTRPACRRAQHEDVDLGRAIDSHRDEHGADAAADKEGAVVFGGFAGHHRKAACRHRAHSWKHHLAAVGMAGEHELHVEGGGLAQPSRIVREHEGRRTGAAHHPGDVGQAPGPEA